MRSMINREGLEILELKRTYDFNQPDIFLKKFIEGQVSTILSNDMLEIFHHKTYQDLKRSLVSSKNFKRTEVDDYLNSVDKFKQMLEETRVKHQIVKCNPDSKKLVIKKVFGMSASDMVEYFGIDNDRSISLATDGFLLTFVDTRLKKKLKDSISDISEKHKDNIQIEFGLAYKDETFNHLCNVDCYITLNGDLKNEILHNAVVSFMALYASYNSFMKDK